MQGNDFKYYLDEKNFTAFEEAISEMQSLVMDIISNYRVNSDSELYLINFKIISNLDRLIDDFYQVFLRANSNATKLNN